jgi:exopolysaccharide biosynthesis polyprenyl glycosylphosphotransferase
VNHMTDMSHPLRDRTTEGWDLRFARMIPGTPGIPQVAPTVLNRPHPGVKEARAISEASQTLSATRRNWARHLIPRFQVADRLVLFELSFLDLLVLFVSCLLPSVMLPAWSLPRLAIPVYAVLVLLFAFSEGLYQNVGAPAAEEFPVLARSALFAMALVLVAAWNEMQPLAALTALVTSLAGLLVWRQVRRKGWNEHFRETGPRNVLIVGGGQTARAIARALREDPLHPSTVVGFVDDHLPLTSQVLGRIEDLDWLARSQFIDEVILAVPNDPTLLREAAAVAFRNHLDIRAVPALPSGLWPDAGVEHIGGIPVIVLHHELLPSATLLLKRLLDVIGALLGLALIGPLMAAMALLIRLDSPGPVFYSAERTGGKGRVFRCYKFRSMNSDADLMKETLRDRNQREGPIFKLKDDPRITRFGQFLRRYSLDELPQFWNVLRGEMSLVGPRPHPVDEVNHYELHHYRRLDMKPGMTGLWQVTARNSPSFDLNMHLDLTYIENWTLQLDLHILLKTVRVLLSPDGA